MTTSIEIRRWRERVTVFDASYMTGNARQAVDAEISDLRAENQRLAAALEAAEKKLAEVYADHGQQHEDPTGPNHPGQHDGHTCAAMGQMLADFGSQRTTPEAVVAALRAKKLAEATEPPSFSRDPDGDLALDWAVGNDVLSVSFSTDGRVAWVATVAGETFSGTELVAQKPDSGCDAALKIATEALEEIRNWLFSWDGDCGVSRRAENALLDIDAAMDAQQGEKDEDAPGAIKSCRLCGARISNLHMGDHMRILHGEKEGA